MCYCDVIVVVVVVGFVIVSAVLLLFECACVVCDVVVS